MQSPTNGTIIPQKNRLKPHSTKGDCWAQQVDSSSPRAKPAVVPDQGAHPVRPPNHRAQPSSKQQPQSTGTSLPNWDSDDMPHLPMDATHSPVLCSNLSWLMKAFSWWSEPVGLEEEIAYIYALILTQKVKDHEDSGEQYTKKKNLKSSNNYP